MPEIAKGKQPITVNGVKYYYAGFDSIDFDGGGWITYYATADKSKRLWLTNNLELTPVKSASKMATILHIDDYYKMQNGQTVAVTTPTTPTTSTVPTNNTVRTFKPYVQGASGTYNNDDVNNKNKYAFPKDSLLTGKYLDKTIPELRTEINRYFGKKQLTEEEAYDYIDICYSYAAKVLGYIPGNVYIDYNNHSDTTIFETDSASYVKVPYKTITKLKNEDNRFSDGYTGKILNSTFWEMLRFVKEQDQIKYVELKNKRPMMEQAEVIRAEIPSEKAYKAETFDTVSDYSRAETDILSYSSVVSFYIGNKLGNSDIQKDFQKKVDWIFEVNMKNKGVSYDGSVPATFNIAAPTLKKDILPRDKFISEIEGGASTINELSQLKNSVSDYGFYIYNIYANPAYGMNTPADKTVKDVIVTGTNVVKSSNYLSNMDEKDLEKYLRVAQYGTGLTPSMINEIEQKGIYSVANLAMWHSDIKTLTTTPYTKEEWAKIKPTVLQTAKEVAVKNKITAQNFEWSTLFSNELRSELNKKGIDITRIHESISNDEFRAAIGK